MICTAHDREDCPERACQGRARQDDRPFFRLDKREAPQPLTEAVEFRKGESRARVTFDHREERGTLQRWAPGGRRTAFRRTRHFSTYLCWVSDFTRTGWTRIEESK